jgi:hypothetical protein
VSIQCLSHPAPLGSSPTSPYADVILSVGARSVMLSGPPLEGGWPGSPTAAPRLRWMIVVS